MSFPYPSPKLGDTDNNLLFKIAQILDSGSGSGGGVASFNARTGAVTLESGDVTTALGFTPAVVGSGVTSFNTRTGAVTLVSGDVTTALGFTPAVAGSGVTSFNTRTGAVTLTLGDVSAVADARYLLKAGDTFTGTLIGTLGTVTADTPFFNLSETWNNAGVVFTGIKLSITDTASNANSALMDLLVGGATKFVVLKDGGMISNGSILAVGNLTAGGSALIKWQGSSQMSAPSNGVILLQDVTTSTFTRLQFGGTTNSFPALGRNGIGFDIFGAAGTGPSALWIYNTKTSGTNFERLDIQWTANVAQLWTEKGSGGGTARALVLGADGTELLRFGSATTLSFFAATAVVKQTSGENLTNNVTVGGTDGTIANFTDLTIYANDAAAIRNDIYQLARKLKQINDGLRAYGLFT